MLLTLNRDRDFNFSKVVTLFLLALLVAFPCLPALSDSVTTVIPC